MRHRLFALVALVIGAIVLAGCGTKVVGWRQNLTIVVDTPEGARTASSVMRIEKHANTSGWRLPEQRAAWSVVEGEALVLELAPGRHLFALISNAASIAQNTMPVDRDRLRYAQLMIAVRYTRGVHHVPSEAYPRLVTFTDVDRPETVQLVDPDDLAATFGPGYRLVSITLEITDEPVTQGRVEDVLEWWHSLAVPIGGDVRRSFGDPLYRLGKWDFVKE